MSIDLLKGNIIQIKTLFARLDYLEQQALRMTDQRSKAQIENGISSTEQQIKILNNAIPQLLKNISLTQSLPSEQAASVNQNQNVQTYSHASVEGNTLVAINKKDKGRYLKELDISNISIKNINKKKEGYEEFSSDFKKPNPYIKFANKLFLNTSRKLVAQKYFLDLREDLIKSNIMILLHSYVSMMFLTTLLSFIFSIFLVIFLIFIDVSFTSPYIAMAAGNLFLRAAKFIGLIILVPAATFAIMYYYPKAERRSLEGQIDYELPFATIQMAAIAGSDIEPSNIFGIIALSREYPAIRKEAKKLMNQINLYGYDLVSALNNVADASPSKAWKELLNGIATTIRSGGSLERFLHKRSETMLFEYRINREKATRAAETFMDIYISVVIAAPMLMMLLLIMISIANLGFSLGVSALTVIIVSIVALINFVFLVFLQMNQKSF